MPRNIGEQRIPRIRMLPRRRADSKTYHEVSEAIKGLGYESSQGFQN